MIRPFKSLQPRIASSAYVDESAVIIGNVTLEEDISIWPMAVLRGDIHSITVGARSNVQDGTIIHVTRPDEKNPQGFPVIIGEDVTIGHQVILHACTIENECLIGMGSIILDGAHIESHVLIGAGSLVPPNKRLEKGYLWIGTPVRKIRPLLEEELAYFKKSAANYVELKNEFLDNTDL